MSNETYMIFGWLNFNRSDLKISTSNDLKINKVIYINLAFLESYFSSFFKKINGLWSLDIELYFFLFLFLLKATIYKLTSVLVYKDNFLK